MSEEALGSLAICFNGGVYCFVRRIAVSTTKILRIYKSLPRAQSMNSKSYADIDGCVSHLALVIEFIK